MLNREIISTNLAPKAIGPYSQAIKTNNFVFISGQIPLNTDGNIIKGDIKEQTEQVLDNLKAILNESGSNFENSLMITIYITDMNNFSKVNDVYENYFFEKPPARACIEVSALPKGVKIEISAIALTN